MVAEDRTRVLQLWLTIPEAERWSEPRSVTLADVRLDPGATLQQELPASYNGFVYVIEGSARVGAGDGTLLGSGDVGWLDRPGEDGSSGLPLTGGEPDGARLVLYAGQPQNVPIVVQGHWWKAWR